MAKDSIKITFDLDRLSDIDLRKVSKDADRSKRRQVAVIVRRVMQSLREKDESLKPSELVR
jgi:hypothetical protein